MFYLTVVILIISYYFFMASKTIHSTLNMIDMVGTVALLPILAAMGFVKVMQSPPGISLGFAMVTLGFFAIRDVYRLPFKKDEKKYYSKKSRGVFSSFCILASFVAGNAVRYWKTP